MKVSNHKPEETDIKSDIQTGPKLRNLNDEKEAPKEAPQDADIRLKLAVAVIAVFIIIIGIKGFFTNSSLTAQVEETQKRLEDAKAKALTYGITEDEDGDLVIPIIDDFRETDDSLTPIEQRNQELLASFMKLLLNWQGEKGYENVRQTLMNEWAFPADSRLLSAFMPPLEEELNANMKYVSHTSFVLENDGKNMSYFLICKVRNTINGTSADGTVGIRITINEDGTISNVTAQTLS